MNKTTIVPATEERVAWIRKWKAERCPDLKCPACGHGEFSTGNDVYSLVDAEDDSFNIRLLVLHCDWCAHCLFFNTRIMERAAP